MNVKYGYKNIFHSFTKIWREPGVKIKNFYPGALWFSISYIVFVSLEFGIHDTILEWIANFTGSSRKSILNFLQISDDDSQK